MTDPRVAAIEKRLSEAEYEVQTMPVDLRPYTALMVELSDMRYLLDQLKAHTEAKETK